MIRKAELIEQTLRKIIPQENAYKKPQVDFGNHLFHHGSKLTIADLKEIDKDKHSNVTDLV